MTTGLTSKEKNYLKNKWANMWMTIGKNLLNIGDRYWKNFNRILIF